MAAVVRRAVAGRKAAVGRKALRPAAAAVVLRVDPKAADFALPHLRPHRYQSRSSGKKRRRRSFVLRNFYKTYYSPPVIADRPRPHYLDSVFILHYSAVYVNMIFCKFIPKKPA